MLHYLCIPTADSLTIFALLQTGRLTTNMPLDCKTSTAYGEEWRNTIRGFFASRIEAGDITIFNNGPMAIRR